MANIGAPLKFESVEVLEGKIKAYFSSCFEINEEGKKVNIRPLTVSGLAVALDTSRQTLINYEDKSSEYFDAIKKAKALIEAFNEEQLYRREQVIGVIFNLKNNWGWKDKTETDVTSDGKALSLPLLHALPNHHSDEEDSKPAKTN